jgi:hypothetical protein
MDYNKINILGNTLEGMAAVADDNGKETIQPVLTLDDVKTIVHALGFLEPVSECKIANNSRRDELTATIDGMTSTDYKERFKAEYYQTKIRYERLKAFNTKIEAANTTTYKGALGGEMPKHDCPDELLREQQKVMGLYLHILEVRAVIEGIAL